MRTIKFKCWDGTKMWKHAVPLHSPAHNGGTVNVSENENGSFNKFVNGELLQFTGLLDRNGTEIYEGDLYKTVGSSYIRQIFFHNGAFCGGMSLEESTPLNWKENEEEVQCDIVVDDFSSCIEVIGNIYETPASS